MFAFLRGDPLLSVLKSVRDNSETHRKFKHIRHHFNICLCLLAPASLNTNYANAGFSGLREVQAEWSFRLPDVLVPNDLTNNLVK